MNLNYRLLELPLEFTFTISRESKTLARTILVELTAQVNGRQVSGLGEAVPAEFYGESPESVIAFYDQLVQDGALDKLDPFNLQSYESRMAKYAGNMAAKAGLNIALYDLQGKALGVPVYQLLGLDPGRAPKTSYTIGIADLETVKRKTETALSRGYDVLKVKVGAPHDLETLALIRETAPQTTIRVDANAAWSVDEALKLMPRLQEYNVEFVEEPLTLQASDADYKRLKAETPVPIMADERCHTLADIPYCAEHYHAINLKHTKTGGLTEALKMIHAARAHGLKIMLGCFAESSVSITAFAHLSPLVDYADLDGGLLLANDPFIGVTFEGSRICLPHRPGLGVTPRG